MEFFSYETGIISTVIPGSRRKLIVKCEIPLKELIKSVRKWPTIYRQPFLATITHLVGLNEVGQPIFEKRGELIVVRAPSDVSEYAIEGRYHYILDIPNNSTRYFKDITYLLSEGGAENSLTRGTFIIVNDFEVNTDDGDAVLYNEYIVHLLTEDLNEPSMEDLLFMATNLKKLA